MYVNFDALVIESSATKRTSPGSAASIAIFIFNLDFAALSLV